MTSPQINFDTAARTGMPRTLDTARILIDECLSVKPGSLQDFFGRVDSVQSVGLQGTKDTNLIDLAAGHYDIILTKDVHARKRTDMLVCLKNKIKQDIADSLRLRLSVTREWTPESLSSALQININLPLVVGVTRDLEFASALTIKNAICAHRKIIEAEMQDRSLCGIVMYNANKYDAYGVFASIRPRIVADVLANEMKERGVEDDLGIRQNIAEAFKLSGVPASARVYLNSHFPSLPTHPCTFTRHSGVHLNA